MMHKLSPLNIQHKTKSNGFIQTIHLQQQNQKIEELTAKLQTLEDEVISYISDNHDDP